MALVSGGEQDVVVAAIGKDGNPENFTVTSGNEEVATVTISDTIFTVTGVDNGTTKVTVTTASGKSREIPVRVYDPLILETEELLITFSQNFRFCWDDRMADYMFPLTKGSYWHPVADDGFKPLGSLAISGYDDPTGKQGVMMVKAKNDSDALAEPVDYTLLFQTQNFPGSLWIPVPPPGYKAMGIVAFAGAFAWDKPRLSDVVCVREDLTIHGEAEDLIQQMRRIMGDWVNLISWKIEPPVAGPHENAYLSTDTFLL